MLQYSPAGQRDQPNLDASQWPDKPWLRDPQRHFNALCVPATETLFRFDRNALFVEDKPPSRRLLATLKADASSVNLIPPHQWRHRGRWVWNPHLTVVIVAPGDTALQALAAQPWTVADVELAKDRIYASTAEPPALHDFFDAAFVHAHHGRKHRMCVYIDPVSGHRTTYTAQRSKGAKRVFCWYSDQPANCFHLEARVRGVRAVRSIGIHSPRDLLTFNHYGFWQEFERLEAIDHEHLARFDDQRRRHACDDDLSAGVRLAHLLSTHPDPLQPLRGVQLLIDAYGRGPFLRRLIIPLFTRPLTAVSPLHSFY